MKAIVITEYGPPDVLQLKEVAKPIPKEDEVLIRVYATPVSYGEVKARNFTFPPRDFWFPLLTYPIARMQMGYNKPKKTILGSELSGEIVAVGKDAKRFKEGDQVFGYLGPSFGADAEYVCMPENSVLELKPANMSYEEAATIPFNAITALAFIRDKGNIQSGEKVR